MTDYTYQAVEYAKLPSYKFTDPALSLLFEAVRVKRDRETGENTEKLGSIEEELCLRSKAWKSEIFEIGRLLWQAKELLPHGSFRPWIEKNFELGIRTAHNCMRVFKACMGHPEVLEYFSASCLYLVAQPNFPTELREALFNGAPTAVDVKKKDLVLLAMKYKNGEITTEDSEVQNILINHRKTTVLEKLKIELGHIFGLIASRLERIDNLKKIDPENPIINDDSIPENILIVDSRIEKSKKIVERFLEHIKKVIGALEEEIKSESVA